MNLQGHLVLDDVMLGPSMEWTPRLAGWCFLRVQQGEGYWLGTEGGVVEAGAGDMLVLSPSCEGTFRASQLGPLTLQYFQFCPDLLSGLLTLVERKHLESLAQRGRHACLRIAADSPAASHFTEVCDLARTSNGLELRCRVLQVAAGVFEKAMERSTPVQRSFLPASQRIRGFLNQLTEAEIMNLSPLELATLCGCSVRHFNRLFKASFGVALRAKQTEVRLLKARQRLSETRATITHIARACGYRHVGLFTAMFKHQFGVTPTQWRAQNAAPTPRSGRGGDATARPGPLPRQP